MQYSGMTYCRSKSNGKLMQPFKKAATLWPPVFNDLNYPDPMAYNMADVHHSWCSAVQRASVVDCLGGPSTKAETYTSLLMVIFTIITDILRATAPIFMNPLIFSLSSLLMLLASGLMCDISGL